MNFDKYDVVVFDVDGTLYFQNRLRLIMAGRLLLFYMTHPHRIKELLILKAFREIRDREKDSGTVYKKTAERMNASQALVERVIEQWIYKNPLDVVYITRDQRLLTLLDELKRAGKTIVIWSDYYALDKLKALNITPDYVYTAEDERVGELKPSPKALKLIMSDLNTHKDKILMVGDRLVKDGEAAIAAGVDYIILGKTKQSRNSFYKSK